jgi:hypothetical protein
MTGSGRSKRQTAIPTAAVPREAIERFLPEKNWSKIRNRVGCHAIYLPSGHEMVIDDPSVFASN